MRTRTVARTGALNVAAQLAMLWVLYVFAHRHPVGASGPARALVLVLVTLLPSAIWAVFFYLQDRRQPEPTANVVMAFAAGGGAGAAILLPAETQLFRVAEWMYGSAGSLALAATLIRGALTATVLYVVIRYGFMPAADFDEPADGMAYGAFAGSGLAAAVSLFQASAHPDFTLFAHAYTASTNVLAYASIGALTGYMVGRAKFQTRAAGLSYAEAIGTGAALTGTYHVLAELAFVEESANAMWMSVGAAVVFAVVVLACATWLMRRLTARADHRSRPVPRRLDVLPAAVAVVLLAAGGLVAWRAVRPVAFEAGGLSFRYDARFVATAGGTPRDGGVSQASFGRGRVRAPQAGELLFSASADGSARISVRRVAGAVALDQLDPTPFITARDPEGLAITERLTGQQRGLRVRFASVTARTGVAGELPRTRWTVVDVVPAGGATFIFCLDALPEEFARVEAAYERLLSTISWPAS